MAFFVELSDRAQMSKQGLSKTTTDERVNNRDNRDTAGATPAGSTTFVRPAQVPKVLAGTGIIITQEQRVVGAPTTGDDGRGILDYRIAFDTSSVVVPQDTMELPMNSDPIVLNEIEAGTTGNVPTFNPTRTIVDLTTINSPTTYVHEAIARLAQAFNEIADLIDGSGGVGANGLMPFLERDRVEVGDVVLAVTDPTSWTPHWMEPRGQVVSQASYPALYARIGGSYNTGGEGAGNFRLPNLSTGDNPYLRAFPSVGGNINTTGGNSAYSLTAANIPQHSHTVNIDTTMAGTHSHTYGVQENSSSGPNQPQGGDGTGTLTNRLTDGAGNHQHNVNGNTGDYGAATVTPIDRKSVV